MLYRCFLLGWSRCETASAAIATPALTSSQPDWLPEAIPHGRNYTCTAWLRSAISVSQDGSKAGWKCHRTSCTLCPTNLNINQMPSQDAGVLRNLPFPAPIIQLQERQPVLAAEGIPRPNYLRAHVGARELRGQRRRRDGSFWELTAFGPAPAALVSRSSGLLQRPKCNHRGSSPQVLSRVVYESPGATPRNTIGTALGPFHILGFADAVTQIY